MCGVDVLLLMAWTHPFNWAVIMCVVCLCECGLCTCVYGGGPQSMLFYQQMQQAHMQAALRWNEEAGDGDDDDFGECLAATPKEARSPQQRRV